LDTTPPSDPNDDMLFRSDDTLKLIKNSDLAYAKILTRKTV